MSVRNVSELYNSTDVQPKHQDTSLASCATRRRTIDVNLEAMSSDDITTLGLNIGTLSIRPNQLQSSSSEPMATAPYPQNSSFRFLDLPAELRNFVYSMITSNKSMSLGSFAVPAIARTSRQLRSEFLPIFFAEAEFRISFSLHAFRSSHLRCVRLYDLQHHIYPEELDHPRAPACDSLCLEPSVRHFFKTLKGGAVFKNVNFIVQDLMAQGLTTDDVKQDGSLKKFMLDARHYSHEDDALARISFAEVKSLLTLRTSGRSGPKVSFSKYYAHEELDLRSWDQREMDKDMKSARNKALAIAAKEDFLGFTLGDLEAVANVFASATSDGSRF